MMNSFQKFLQNLTQYGLEYFGLFYGSYRGVVIDNRDPEMLGRLKISCSSIYGDEVPAYWAWPKVSFAGNQTGFFAIPEIGDGVYIECEGGNPKYPVWSGGWWAKPDSNSEVPEVARKNPPSNRIWQTASGHKIELDDTSGAEKIKITEKSGNYILLESASGKEKHQVSGDKEENVGGAWNITVVGKATISANVIELDGGSGAVMGLITGASICHFSGSPHGDKSTNVKASK
ncbi:MAG: phage baseplate assembly protein V [bacterium]